MLLAEAEEDLGGVLRQCAHRGFGAALFGAEVTGPEYAAYWRQRLARSRAEVRTGVTALSLDPDRTVLLSGREGLRRVSFRGCVLAAGCYERPLESLCPAGTRPAGVFTAGTAQALLNLDRRSVGERIVILGSGDVGQIMARQFSEAGKEVVCVVEQRQALGGLPRNRQACIRAFRIPVLLRTTVTELLGEGRLRGVRVRELDSGRERVIPCDTLVTAIGLVPDRALCAALPCPWPAWLCLCGNCDYVHDMVELAVRDARKGTERLLERLGL